MYVFKNMFKNTLLKKFFYLSGMSFFLSGLIVSLTGCASTALKRQHCKTVDVYKQGYDDGLKGLSDRSFTSYQQKCSDFVEVSEKQILYKQGWEKAITVFCTKKMGYEFGLKGGQYQNICPKKTEPLFLKGFKEGAKKCLYESGYQSALNDQPASYIQSACAKEEGKRSEIAYKRGRQRGLKVFCGYKNGYKLGVAGKSYQIVCSKKSGFFKGYRAGDRKCLYNAGYEHVVAGKVSAFDQSSCQKLKGNKNSYQAGRTAGIKVFCTYKSGYNYGLKGFQYENICPKSKEENFFKGYTVGSQEYRAEKRQQEILQIERERIQAEERTRQAKERTRQAILNLERERIASEERQEQQRLELEQEELELKRQLLLGRQPCSFDSDCDAGYECSFMKKLCVRKK